MNLEHFFSQFREQIIGINQTFNSPYGEQKLVYADWTASGRLYRPIEEKICNELFVESNYTFTDRYQLLY